MNNTNPFIEIIDKIIFPGAGPESIATELIKIKKLNLFKY